MTELLPFAALDWASLQSWPSGWKPLSMMGSISAHRGTMHSTLHPCKTLNTVTRMGQALAKTEQERGSVHVVQVQNHWGTSNYMYLKPTQHNNNNNSIYN